MPKQGEIRVWMTREAAAAAGEWLSAVYVPYLARKPVSMAGLLGLPDAMADSSRRLNRLSELLAKAGRRKRQAGKFSINIPRDSARSLVSVVESYRYPAPILGMSSSAYSHQLLMTGPLPPNVKAAAEWIKVSTGARRGRPTLSATERKLRLRPDYACDDRHKMRVKRTDRNHEVLATLILSGGSLLGLTRPRSEI